MAVCHRKYALDENPYETALRELKEETGISKQRSDLIFIIKAINL